MPRLFRFLVALSGRVAFVIFSCVCVSAGAFAADSDKAAKYYEDGLARFERNDLGGAIVQLKNAIQQDNRLLAAQLLLGRALLRNGDAAAAEAALGEALKLGVSRAEVMIPFAQALMLLNKQQSVIDRITVDGLPPAVQVEVLSIRGKAYADLGQKSESSRCFEQARGIDPKSATPLIAEIPLLLGAGQVDRAKDIAERAVTLAPNSAEAWNMGASVAHVAGSLQVALERYGKALALQPNHVEARIARASLLADLMRDKEASADLQALEKIAPTDPRGKFLQAKLAKRAGRMAEADTLLAEVAALVDNLTSEWVSSREQILLLGALAHHGLGEPDKARSYIESILKKNPRHAAARKLSATMYLERDDPVLAISAVESLVRDTPRDAQVFVLMGRGWLQQKRYLKAAESFDQAIKLGGDFAEVRFGLGMAQIGLGQPVAAIKQFELALVKQPGDLQIGLMLATQYVRQGESKKAVAVAETVVAKHPADVHAMNQLGAIKAAIGDLNGARQAYQQALAKNSKFVPAAINLSRIDVVQGRLGEARDRLVPIASAGQGDAFAAYELGLLERQANRPSEAIRWLEKAMELRPSEAQAGIALADLHLQLRHPDQALGIARSVVARGADNAAALTILVRAQLAVGDQKAAADTFKELTKLAEYDAVEQVKIGRMQLEAGILEGAAYNAQKALAGAAGNVDALSLQGEVALLRRDFGAAEAAVRELLAKHPGRMEGYRLQGDIAAARDQMLAALQSYRAAFAKQPSGSLALTVARATAMTGEPGKSTGVLESWLARNEKDFTVRMALADLHLANANWSATRQQYEKLLVQRPGDPQVLNNLAIVLQRLKDPSALAIAERAQKAAPDVPAVLDTLGWVLVQQGQVDRGLRYLRDARLRLPSVAEIRYHLAEALAKAGKREEARIEVEAALAGGAGGTWIDDAKRLRSGL